jgi:hypothetical protein
MTEGVAGERSAVQSSRGSRARVALLIGLAVVAAAVTAWLPPIAQDPAYHRFADTRSLAGVQNVANVLSNVGFVVVGIAGLVWLRRPGRSPAGRPLPSPSKKAAIAVLFSGVVLTGIGSGYYHLEPDNARLVWDRLPMTLAFMSLFALVIGDRVDVRAGRLLLAPLLAVGVASVVSWHLSETVGRGDLRLYALVQFFPMIAIPVILVLFPDRAGGGAWLWTALGFYAIAKVAELADAFVFAHGGIVSGHTLKHLLAAIATGCILGMLATRRRPVEASRSQPRAELQKM